MRSVIDFLTEHDSSFAEAGVVLTRPIPDTEPGLRVVLATVTEEALALPQPNYVPPVAVVLLDVNDEIIAMARDLGDRTIVNQNGPDIEFHDWRPQPFATSGLEQLGFRCVFGRAGGLASRVAIVDTGGLELDSCPIADGVFLLTFPRYGDPITLEVWGDREQLHGTMRVMRLGR
jgi:hypothetical protein